MVRRRSVQVLEADQFRRMEVIGLYLFLSDAFAKKALQAALVVCEVTAQGREKFFVINGCKRLEVTIVDRSDGALGCE